MEYRNAYALLIGVGGGNIAKTIKDAEDIERLLTNPGLAGYSKENVITLTGKRATKDHILDHLNKLVEIADENEKCSVLIYFSGHGATIKSFQ